MKKFSIDPVIYDPKAASRQGRRGFIYGATFTMGLMTGLTALIWVVIYSHDPEVAVLQEAHGLPEEATGGRKPGAAGIGLSFGAGAGQVQPDSRMAGYPVYEPSAGMTLAATPPAAPPTLPTAPLSLASVPLAETPPAVPMAEAIPVTPPASVPLAEVSPEVAPGVPPASQTPVRMSDSSVTEAAAGNTGKCGRDMTGLPVTLEAYADQFHLTRRQLNIAITSNSYSDFTAFEVQYRKFRDLDVQAEDELLATGAEGCDGIPVEVVRNALLTLKDRRIVFQRGMIVAGKSAATRRQMLRGLQYDLARIDLDDIRID